MVYATFIPRAANGFPMIPVLEYIFDKVIPATAVGSANGSSINPSKIRFPGKSYRVSVQANITPNTTLIHAAKKEHPMLVANAYNTFDLVRSPKNSDGDNFKEYTITDASGISTISESIVTVIPSVK